MLRRKTYPTVSYYPDSSSVSIGKESDYRLNFSQSLGKYHTRIRDKIVALRTINKLTSPLLESYLQNLKDANYRKIAELDDKEMEQYKLYDKSFRDPNAIPYQTKNKKVARLIYEETAMYNHRENVKRASKEMMVVYLVIIFEEYLTDILTALFRKRPSILKTSQKSITYEEAFEHRNLAELLHSIGRKQVDSKIGSDIEELATYLASLNILINTRGDWDQFKEHFYRRHVIVHNSGIPNSKYIQKTGYTGPIDWLEVDDKYLEEAFKIFEVYSDELGDLFYDKFGKNRTGKKRKRKP